MAANPGMRSRFPRSIEFPDYTSAELVEIFGTTLAPRSVMFVQTLRQPRPFRFTSTRAKPGVVSAPALGPNRSKRETL